METLPLLVLLLALAAGTAITLLQLRRRREAGRRQASEPAADPTIEMETQVRDGTTVATMPELPEPPRPWYRRPIVPIAIGTALLLLALFALPAIYGSLTARSPERFVVLVAPFADGGDGQTGRNVAGELAQAISTASRGAITVAVAPTTPTTPAEALALAEAEGSDVLIWGDVEQGGMLDGATLRPRLVYTPTGPYAPNAWDGYTGRFVMPRGYTLADEPLNGQAVLVPLVVALYDYGRGQPDLAALTLDQLLQNYPSLSATLPRALRGNLLWARGAYPQAAAEYRLALGAPTDEAALLANNLGAVLQDAGDPAALTAYAEAVRLLDGQDLGALRANLGRLALSEQRPADAVIELEQARNLMPASMPLLLDLTAAYRDSGQLDRAAATLTDAAAQRARDARLVPSVYSAMYSQSAQAAIDEQRALLELARELEAQGPVLWELEAARPQQATLISSVRERLRGAADASGRAVDQWRRRSASESAAFPGTGLVATGQAERAERHVRQQRYYEGFVGAELERGARAPARNFFTALFGGGGTGSQSLDTILPLVQVDPNNPQLHLAAGRAQRFTGQLDAADQSYDRAISLAPQRPEGYYGKGMVAYARGDAPRAAEELNLALDRNGAFFPARVALATIAEDGRDWPTAVVHLRALNEARPGAPSAVALAQALRLGGQPGWQEAEQILIPLAASDADAAIELGRLYNDAGKADVAISAYRDALRLDPRNSVAAFELGESLAAQGDYAGAEAALRDALRFDETNLDARLALGDLYEGPLNDPSRADREYRAALAQGVNDPDHLARIGDAAAAIGNPDQAVRAYSDALRLRPDSPELHYKLGRAYAAWNRRDAAIAEQNKVITLTENPPTSDLAALRASALIALGDLSREQGRLADASSYYTQALQIDGNRIAAQIGLGLSAVGQGNWGVAHGYFETAAALPGGTENADAQFWLAESLLRRGDLSTAVTRYESAIAIQPRFPAAYLGLAQARYAQGNRQAALEQADAALRQQPNYAEALLFKGKLLQEAGRFVEAMSAYNQSISANGRIAETFYRRGVLKIQEGDYGGAISDLNRAARLQPNFPEAAYWLGRAYYAQGRLDQALSAFRDAIRYNGNYADAIFYSGLVAEDMGRTAEAISAYQTVIQIDGNGDLGARARAQLDRLT